MAKQLNTMPAVSAIRKPRATERVPLL